MVGVAVMIWALQKKELVKVSWKGTGLLHRVLERGEIKLGKSYCKVWEALMGKLTEVTRESGNGWRRGKKNGIEKVDFVDIYLDSNGSNVVDIEDSVATYILFTNGVYS